MNNCILIDGNSLLYRMFYGMRPMNSPKGVPTSAVYGFMNVLLKVKNEYDPEYIAVAFDRAEPTFRHEAYPDYKAGREAMPEDLAIQQKTVKELLEAMDIAIVEKKGFEADDIIGTLAREMVDDGVKVEIITGDRDTFQLVSDDVTVLYTATRSGNQLADVDPAYIEKKYGVTPGELRTVKALMGDKSDNIPGINGVGEKTALKLVKEYHTLENIYAHTDDLKGKMKERIVNGKDDAYDSYFLGTIDCRVDLGEKYSPKNLKFHGLLNPQSEKILRDLGFRSILNKLENPEKKVQADTKTRSAVELTSRNEVIGTLGKINKHQKMTINYYRYDTPENDPYHAPGEGGDIYLAFEVDGFYYFLSDQGCVKTFITGLTEIPNADKVKTIGHNFKNLEKIYNYYGSCITNLTFDVYIAAYLNDPSNGQYDLSAIAQKWLDMDYPSEADFFGKGRNRKSVEEVGISALKSWLVSGCEIIKEVAPMIEEKIKEDGMEGLYRDIELGLEPVLAEMEECGFKIDCSRLEELSNDFAVKEDAISREIYDLAGTGPFNIGSPKQLGEVLFEKLGLPVIKRTKTGYSTNAAVLEELKPTHPIIEKILEWRMLNKLNSTYGKGLMAFVDPETDKIYSTFQQTVTTTGRISSTDPNLQNIPVKTEMGREIRKVFIASSPDRVLVDADYSQIELRVLAALSGDKDLIEAFKHHADVHSSTASKVFGVDVADVTPTQRGFAKTINFGLIYGKQAFTLAKDLGISRAEAQNFIDTYFNTYPKIKDYLEGSIESAREKGYSETFTGRRRYIPEITSRNRVVAQSGERMAQNMPIQGAAADIIKKAMVDVYQALKEARLDAKLILQVHDELIIDVSKKDAERAKEILVDKMVHAVDLDVPLEVDANIGYSWYEAK